MVIRISEISSDYTGRELGETKPPRFHSGEESFIYDPKLSLS